MLNYYWPIIIVVLSNVLYHICSKSISQEINLYFSFLVTYFVAALICLALYLYTGHFNNFYSNIKTIRWNAALLGVSIVCLELGFVMMYKVGWNISIGSLVANISLAIALVLVGVFFYKENLSTNQIIGMILCISGLIFINR